MELSRRNSIKVQDLGCFCATSFGGFVAVAVVLSPLLRREALITSTSQAPSLERNFEKLHGGKIQAGIPRISIWCGACYFVRAHTGPATAGGAAPNVSRRYSEERNWCIFSIFLRADSFSLPAGNGILFIRFFFFHFFLLLFYINSQNQSYGL